MSMILILTAVDDQTVNEVLANPQTIHAVLSPEDFVAAAEPTPKRKKQSWLARLLGTKPDQPTPSAPAPAPKSGPGKTYESTDLDKAWHGIHFLLTGTAWEGEEPLNFLVQGGKQVGDIDVGYGPARAYNSTQTQLIWKALKTIDEAQLRKRFDPKQMSKLRIYPTIWSRNPKENDMLGYCSGHFNKLKQFVEKAVEKGQGLIIHIA